MAGLEGLRVLDMSSGIAGPFCARLLADSGADVIRIARPAPAESGLDRRGQGIGPLAAFLDRNKRGVVLDPGAGRDRERFERLVARIATMRRITSRSRRSAAGSILSVRRTASRSRSASP